MAEIGTVEVIAFGFGPGAELDGDTDIVEELVELDRGGAVRILDLLFVERDAETGDLIATELQGEDLGGIVGALLGFEFEEVDSSPAASNGRHGQALGLSEIDLQELAEALEPGTSASFILIEHLWDRGLRSAVRDAGGVPLAEGFLASEAISTVAVELQAMADQLDELDGD